MAYEIKFSKRALREYKNIINYLLEFWSEEVAHKFINKFNNKLEVISKFPFSYPVILNGKQIRKCVLTKHTSLYYKISYKRILIILLFDNRQSSDKLDLK